MTQFIDERKQKLEQQKRNKAGINIQTNILDTQNILKSVL